MWLAVIWLVLTVAFVVVELFADRYVLPFALGAGAAGIAALFSLEPWAQVVALAVVTLLGYVLFRPKKKPRKKARGHADEDDFGF